MSNFRREEAWQELRRAAKDKKHPMRTPQLASVFEAEPHIRTVVLRKVDQTNRCFYIYTDSRSSKIHHFGQNARFSLLFWYPRKNYQIRCSGVITLVAEKNLIPIWQNLPKVARKTYATLQAPGQILDQVGDGLPPNWEELSLEQTDYALANFCILNLEVSQMDILLLKREGHERSLHRFAEGTWQDTWIVP